MTRRGMVYEIREGSFVLAQFSSQTKAKTYLKECKAQGKKVSIVTSFTESDTKALKEPKTKKSEPKPKTKKAEPKPNGAEPGVKRKPSLTFDSDVNDYLLSEGYEGVRSGVTFRQLFDHIVVGINSPESLIGPLGSEAEMEIVRVLANLSSRPQSGIQYAIEEARKIEGGIPKSLLDRVLGEESMSGRVKEYLVVYEDTLYVVKTSRDVPGKLPLHGIICVVCGSMYPDDGSIDSALQMGCSCCHGTRFDHTYDLIPIEHQ